MRIVKRCCFAILGLVFMTAPVAADPPRGESLPAGRYQLVAALDGTVYVLDTATGQCWSRAGRAKWVDEGNPTLSEETALGAPELKLPQDKILMTIKQRQSKPIPGSDERVRLCLDDITAGQVLVSVRLTEGDALMDDRSMSAGDVVEFKLGETAYYIRLVELTDVPLGDDIAELEVTAHQELVQPTLELEPEPEK